MEEDLEDRLGIPELRAGFLEYSRQAWARVADRQPRRILDVGCGRGEGTLELARLSKGNILGIDLDEGALRGLRSRIEAAGLGDRIGVRRSNLLDSGLEAGSFDLVWAEGSLHLMDEAAGMKECRRILAPGGHLVLAETVSWIERLPSRLPGLGFEEVDRIPWASGCWWTDYCAPLERRIEELRASSAGARDPRGLGRHEGEIDMVRRNPAAFDCAHLILRSAD